MKPFSALYFIKENKRRCGLLMFMIFLSFGVYLGGLYITNPMDNWKVPISYYENIVSLRGSAYEDEDFQYMVNQAREDGKVTVIEVGSYQSFGWKTIMAFDSGSVSFTFRCVEDFKTFCEYFGITCDFDQLGDGSLIVSERFAKNQGLELGDKVDKNFGWNVYDEFTLDALTDEEGYIAYFIQEPEEPLPSAIFIGEQIHGKELYDYAYELQSQTGDPDDIYIYPGLAEDIGNQFETFNLIYMFIVVLLSVILAVTINAAFVGMYQKREYEFAVYRAIGISKKRMIWKIARELLWMDVLALAAGAVITVAGLYLFNHLVLYPDGKYLRYFEGLAFWNLLLCNVIIVVLLIVTRCRKMMKVDICNY